MSGPYMTSKTVRGTTTARKRFAKGSRTPKRTSFKGSVTRTYASVRDKKKSLRITSCRMFGLEGLTR